MKRTAERERATDDRQSGEAEASPPSTAAGEVLRLQRSAGNRAVAAMLARDTTKSPEKPKDGKGAAAGGPRVVFPGIGEIPIHSLQWAGGRGAPGTGGGKADSPKEVAFTSTVGEHSTALLRESLTGDAKDVEVVWPSHDGKGMLRITLKAALVSTYTTSGGDPPMETWALNFQAVEIQQPDGGSAENEYE
jgi:hypothetical protein